MKRFVLLLVPILARAADPTPRVAVLAELFTSEGCSSCPSADALLMKLDKLQPVPGAQIVVLSEHVDYWNSLGWTDPYSSQQFTQRQVMYARTLHGDEPYTPQLVIDGRVAFVGSNQNEILPALAKEAALPKTAVKIASAKRDGKDAVVNVSVGASSSKAEVWVAIADDHDQSSVRKGENSGKTLDHVAVVRSLTKIGTTPKAKGFEKEVRIPITTQAGPMRVVVFVAESGGPVLGTAIQELP